MDLVLIPAYNEEATVDAVVQSVRSVLPGVDIVVVNDRSSDGTARVAEGAGARVVHTRRRHGYGAALMYGFQFAAAEGYEFTATIDADGQHDPRHLTRLFERARTCDVVSGSRYHALSTAGEGVPPPDRVRLNREFTDLINCITGWSLTDAFCGLKCYRAASLSRLSLSEAGYGFPLQFWMQAWHAGLTVVEEPVERIYRSVKREFGGGLDDAERRRAYYRSIIRREVAGSAQPCLDAVG